MTKKEELKNLIKTLFGDGARIEYAPNEAGYQTVTVFNLESAQMICKETIALEPGQDPLDYENISGKIIEKLKQQAS